MPQISPDAKHIIISVNPKSGRTSSMPRAEELRERLTAKKFTAEIATDLDYVGSTARALHAEGKLRALVGVGGDGTAAELVNRTEPLTPYAILAAGNANLIAKYFRIGKSPERLADLIEKGHTITLDAGRANGRLFLVMIGVGFDGEVVKRVHANRMESYQRGAKKGAHVTNLSYAKPIIQAICQYKYPKVTIEAYLAASPCEAISCASQGEAAKQVAQWIFISNLNTYGWGVPIVPAAKGNDGRLDHCLMRGGLIAGSIYTAFAQTGLHGCLPGVTLGQAVRYKLTASYPVEYQLDGDPGGQLPVEVEIVRSRLALIVPPEIDPTSPKAAKFGL